MAFLGFSYVVGCFRRSYLQS